MKRPPWPARAIFRYATFQVPGLALWVLVLILIARWFDLPSWSVWVLSILWVSKDALLFPFVWQAYDPRPAGLNSLIGSKGIVEKPLSPEGYVRIRGELWQAEAREKNRVEKGEAVRVQEIRGLTLIVQRLFSEHPSG